MQVRIRFAACAITHPGQGRVVQQFDPAILRQLAARYRERAKAEPEQAELFESIAADMEAHAQLAEKSAG